MAELETATIGTRVILRRDPIHQGRIVAIHEDVEILDEERAHLRRQVRVQIEWDHGDDDFDDTDNPWWPFSDFHVPKKYQPEEAEQG